METRPQGCIRALIDMIDGGAQTWEGKEADYGVVFDARDCAMSASGCLSGSWPGRIS